MVENWNSFATFGSLCVLLVYSLHVTLQVWLVSKVSLRKLLPHTCAITLVINLTNCHLSLAGRRRVPPVELQCQGLPGVLQEQGATPALPVARMAMGYMVPPPQPSAQCTYVCAFWFITHKSCSKSTVGSFVFIRHMICKVHCCSRTW